MKLCWCDSKLFSSDLKLFSSNLEIIFVCFQVREIIVQVMASYSVVISSTFEYFRDTKNGMISILLHPLLVSCPSVLFCRLWALSHHHPTRRDATSAAILPLLRLPTISAAIPPSATRTATSVVYAAVLSLLQLHVLAPNFAKWIGASSAKFWPPTGRQQLEEALTQSTQHRNKGAAPSLFAVFQHVIGRAFRETGQMLDRVGVRGVIPRQTGPTTWSQRHLPIQGSPKSTQTIIQFILERSTDGPWYYFRVGIFGTFRLTACRLNGDNRRIELLHATTQLFIWWHK